MIYEEIVKKVAFNIKVLRMKKGLTQFEFAEQINVHEKYVGKVECGKQNITLKTLVKIAQALGVEISELFV